MNNYLKKIISTVSLGVVFLIPFANANAAAFIDIPEIEGEVSQTGYMGMTELDAVETKFNNNACGTFTVFKESDSTSAPLIAAAALGRTFENVSIHYVTAQSETINGPLNLVTYMEFQLSNVTVASLSVDGADAASGNIPNERVKLKAEAVTVKYNYLFGGTSFEETVQCN